MLKIDFDFDVEGEAYEDPYLDPYELNMLFEQTRQSLETGLRRKLEGVVCAEHEQEPSIKITGRYNNETEQMDINYHIDTCCQMFLVRVVSTINNA